MGIKRNALFPGSDNGFTSYAQINHKIERVLVSAGMKDKKFTKHDFRRSCAMFLCYDLKLPKDQAITFFGWTSTDMLDEVYVKHNEIQKADMLEESLDNVGFFDTKYPIMYAKEGRVYFGKEVDENFNEAELDEYRKHYHKDDSTKGYDMKKGKRSKYFIGH